MEKEYLDQILAGVKIEFINKCPIGGQQAGIRTPRIRVSHEEYDITIEIGEGRTNHKNKELALILFKLALDDLYR